MWSKPGRGGAVTPALEYLECDKNIVSTKQ